MHVNGTGAFRGLMTTCRQVRWKVQQQCKMSKSLACLPAHTTFAAAHLPPADCLGTNCLNAAHIPLLTCSSIAKTASSRFTAAA
jgi:hypothetical protein